MVGNSIGRGVSAIAVSAALAAGTLEGCDRPAVPSAAPASAALALPLTTGDATPVAPAPPVTDLPSAQRPRIVRVRDPSQRYAYVDQAYAMSRAIGRAPPDYGFEYQGARPWVWRTSANAMRLVEPVDGGYRNYFFRPGADEPYLVRDAQDSYGFSDGQLVTVYGADGRVLDPEEIDRRADWAGRYLARGRALYYAAQQNSRESVIAANWQARRDQVDVARAQWEAEQDRDDDWRAYHAQHEADENAYWAAERDRREQYAQGYDSWSQRRFQGPPPPAYDRGPGPQAGYGGGGVAPAIIGAGAVAGLLAVFGQGHHHDGDDRRGQYPPQSQPSNGQQAQVGQAQVVAAQQAQDQMRARQQAMQQGRQQQQQADAARAAGQQAQQQAMMQARQQQQQFDAGRVASQQAQQRAQQQSLIQARQQQQQADAGRVASQQAQQRAQQLSLMQARQQQAYADRNAQVQAQQEAAQARGRQQAEAAQQAERQAQAQAAARAGAQAQAQAQAQARYAQSQAHAAARAAQAQAQASRVAAVQASARAEQAQVRNAQAAQAAQAQAARGKAAADATHRPREDPRDNRR